MLLSCQGSFRMKYLTNFKDKFTGLTHFYTSIILASLCFSFSVNANKLVLFELNKQPAHQALTRYGQLTQQTVLFPFDLTAKIQTNTVQGYYSKEHALSLLLRQTGLTANYLDNNTIKITKVKQNNNTSKEIKSAESPKLKLENNKTTPSIEKIAIIGSRSINRSIDDLPVPIDILSSEMLINTGHSELSKMLQSIAPSFNVSSSSISDGTDVLKPATLRGLGPDQTLILVNGKRRHHASLIHINTSVGRGTAGADLNAIPVNAIKRIEILRDGAAAQYGSDAIAGVINIVLKGQNATDNVYINAGQYTRGDGEAIDASFNSTIKLSDRGFINSTLSIQDHQPTDRAGLHGTCQYEQCTLVDDNVYQTTDVREINANRDTFDIGDPSYQQYALSYNAQYDFNSVQGYSFATYSMRENDSAAFFRHNANNQANPKLDDGLAVVQAGYLPFIHSDISDSAITLGLRSDLPLDSSIDVSYSYGKNKIDYKTVQSINASYANYLHYSQQYSADKIRQNMPSSAKAYNLSLSLQTANIDLQSHFDWFDIAIGFEWRHDKYQVTAGDQYSYFDYDNDIANFGVNALGGIQGFPGIDKQSEVDEQREVYSFYSEFNSDLTESLFVNLAMRYDNYDDFGDTSNIKIAAGWQLNDTFKLRSSVSTGFRAPSMQQVYFNNTSTQFLVDQENNLTAERVGTFRNDSSLAKAIGIPNLKEEQSTNISLGAVINLNEQLNITLDYYAINIDDRIVISNKLCAEYSPILEQALLAEGVDKAQVFLNGADTETRGIDIISTWQDLFYKGELSLTLAANFTDTEVSQLYTPNTGSLHLLEIEQVFNQQDISIIEEWQPQDRVNFTALYQQENWSMNLSINRFGEYTITDGERQTFEPEILTDIRFQYFVSQHLSWFIGGNNIFDTMPDKNTIGNSHGGTIIDGENNVIVNSPGVFKYSRRSAPFGFNGSYYYLGLHYQF